MLGLQQLARMLDQGRSNQVLEACTEAASPLPISIRLQFEASGSIGCSAASFALKRMTELSFRTTPPIEHAAESLLGHQQEDGSFSPENCPAVTIAAISALCAVLDLAEQTAQNPPPALAGLLARTEAAIDHALEYISSARALSHDGLVSDTHTTAYLVLTIARTRRLRTSLDAGQFIAALRAAGAHHDRHGAPMLLHAERLLSTAPLMSASTAA